MSNKIQWEAHDDDPNMKVSVCGRFEASLDLVYGYWCLHIEGDTTSSLAEARSLGDLALEAGRLVETGQVA